MVSRNVKWNRGNETILLWKNNKVFIPRVGCNIFN